jgi:hypothetical protein
VIVDQRSILNVLSQLDCVQLRTAYQFSCFICLGFATGGRQGSDVRPARHYGNGICCCITADESLMGDLVKWVTVKFLGTNVSCTLGWPYTEDTWLYCDYFIWCVSWTVVVVTWCVMCGCVYVWVCMVGFVMCGCFDNWVGVLIICVLIFVLYCLCCVFVLFRLCIFILICFVCTGVRTNPTEWKLNSSNNNNNNNNNNNKTIGKVGLLNSVWALTYIVIMVCGSRVLKTLQNLTVGWGRQNPTPSSDLLF